MLMCGYEMGFHHHYIWLITISLWSLLLSKRFVRSVARGWHSPIRVIVAFYGTAEFITCTTLNTKNLVFVIVAIPVTEAGLKTRTSTSSSSHWDHSNNKIIQTWIIVINWFVLCGWYNCCCCVVRVNRGQKETERLIDIWNNNFRKWLL